LINNPIPTPHKADLYFVYASFYDVERHYTAAVEIADQGLASKYEPHIRMKQIAWLITDRQFDKARVYLQKARAEFNPITTRLYGQHLNFLEQEIERLQSKN
jgi:hypothetical protein